MRTKANNVDNRNRGALLCSAKRLLLLCCAGFTTILPARLAAEDAEPRAAATAVPLDPASNPSTGDSKQATAEAPDLTGRSADDVEAALGKPQGKLQTAKGPLWLYAQWRVQFDQKGNVLKVDEDKPVRLTKVDPAFIEAANAVDKAAAARAKAEAAERARIEAAERARAEAVKVISNGGQEVDLLSLLSADKVTIVDFYADWCGPCRQLSPHLEKLAKDDPNVVLLKVDIVKWGTPVARQFSLESIPNVRVFNRAKVQVGNATHDLNLITENVKKAKGA